MKTCRPHRLWSAALVAAVLSLGSLNLFAAPIPAKGGVVVIGSSASSGDEFATAHEFVSVETFGMTSTFTFADGSSKQLQPPVLRKMVPYPIYGQLTLVSDEDWKGLEKIGAEAQETARRYPKAVALMQPLIGQIVAAMDKHRQGNVVVAGRWMPLQEFQRQHANAKADYVPMLEIAGKTYKNVRMSAVKDLEIKLMHDGGFSTVQLDDLKKLPDAQRKELARTNPRMAPLLGFKAEELGASAGSVAASAVSDASRPTTFSFSISGKNVIINRIGGQETYALDKVPQELLDANVDLARAVKAAGSR
ncbi:hypothetical protein [Verrucomicrobium sp. BvORR034]|jgi:hypothetical protein|uniref:hypothetical protein n=1 Tax=Verrucomicrobium sp. BvORR034 TaxID=1396418 RepID=UPI000678FECF|nr:hypothetical protein [Verrucomicrobium sp. BvORR034]